MCFSKCLKPAFILFFLPIALLGIRFGFSQNQDCSSVNLEKANDYYRRQKSEAAKSILISLTGCGDPVGTNAKDLLKQIQNAERCQTPRNSAAAAIMRGDFEKACTFISQMEKICPDSVEIGTLKSKARGCRNENAEEEFKKALGLEKDGRYTEALGILDQIKNRLPAFPELDETYRRIRVRSSDRDHRAALKLENQKKYPEALEILRTVKEQNPDYPGIDGDIARVEKESSRPAEGCPFDDFLRRAQDQTSRNNYEAALDWIQKALNCRKGNPNAEGMQSEIERAIKSEREVLGNARGIYYKGRYDECHTLLHTLVASGKASPKAQKQAEFLLAASAISTYLISGESKSDTKADGLRHYERFKSNPSDIVIMPNAISPKVLGILENTSAQAKP
jgi:hypothetical protein